MSSLTFLGAAGTVTGSKHLLEVGGRRILVDCGLFQGLKELRRRNWEPPPMEPSRIDAVVLTHAHLDHCGYLPRLVASGFRGRVFCTPGAKELCSLVLPDSAHLQEEDAREANRTILFGGDLGRYGRPVLPDPSPIAEADYLLLESTCGDRLHEKDDKGDSRIGTDVRWKVHIAAHQERVPLDVG